MIRVTRWAVPALVVAIPLGVAWSVMAGSAGGAAGLERAKEMAQLIQQGQLNLRDATSIAERHVKGTALEVTCNIQPGGTPAGERHGNPLGEQAEDPAAGEKESPEKIAGSRLVYEVCCFADDKIQAVQVDGMEKKVIDVKERPSLTGAAG